MVIDSNLVLMDSTAILGTAVTGNAVPLTSFLKPGREEPIPICAKVVGTDFAGGTSITFKLTQCATSDGTYTDVPGSSVTVALADLTVGKSIGWRFLPRGVTAPWLKMVATPSGTFAAGNVFAAVVREDALPMEAGMYIDKGVVKG